MGRTGTRRWIVFLGTLSFSLILAAVSPGSLPAEKAMDLVANVMTLPEWPARMLRNLVVRTVDLAAGERALRERIDRLERENLVLRGLLQVSTDYGTRTGTNEGHVTLRPPTSWWSEVRIDRGAREGIRPGMAVVQDGALVGLVSRVESGSSWVELVTSSSQYIPVVVEETRDLGVLNGDGNGLVWLMYIPVEKEMKAGMSVSTALVSELLPPGIPIGRIAGAGEEIGGYRLYRITLNADLSRLYKVKVMTGGRS
ncbi:MAG: rod shape-determining protein MreC [Synergistaceae bacterium]|nr:rod shape-determining protein MreC [Synergistaceae bacterium]